MQTVRPQIGNPVATILFIEHVAARSSRWHLSSDGHSCNLNSDSKPPFANVVELTGGSRKQQAEGRWRTGFVTVVIPIKRHCAGEPGKKADLFAED